MTIYECIHTKNLFFSTLENSDVRNGHKQCNPRRKLWQCDLLASADATLNQE